MLCKLYFKVLYKFSFMLLIMNVTHTQIVSIGYSVPDHTICGNIIMIRIDVLIKSHLLLQC